MQGATSRTMVAPGLLRLWQKRSVGRLRTDGAGDVVVRKAEGSQQIRDRPVSPGAATHAVTGCRVKFLTLICALGFGLSAITVAAESISAGSTPSNERPVADAGPNLSVHVFEAVTIDGSKSYALAPPDARAVGASDESLITFRWSILQAPIGSGAQIDETSPAPVFVPDVPGSYILLLVVMDEDGSASLPARVTLTAHAGNAAPVALIDGRRSVAPGTPVEVDGRPSHDPDADPLSFRWSFASLPAASKLTDGSLSSRDAAIARFTPDVEGRYVLGLQVGDGQFTDIAYTEVAAIEGNLPPVAGIESDAVVLNGADIHLDGAGSFDPDAAPSTLRYHWSLVARPAASVRTHRDIRGADAMRAEFTPDAEGVYVFRLDVSDGDKHDADNVLVQFRRATTAAELVYQ